MKSKVDQIDIERRTDFGNLFSHDSDVSDFFPQEKSIANFNKSPDGQIQFLKPRCDFTSNVIVETDNLAIDNSSERSEIQADMLISMKSVYNRPFKDEKSTFVVEKGNDGKIIPLPTRKAEENQKLYLSKYGVYINLPSMYVLDSQICNKFPDYCIQLAKVVLPGQEDYLVNTHYLNGDSQINTFEQIEGKYSKGLILRLLLREKSQLILLKEVVLTDIWEAYIKFSDCGNLFTLIIPSSKKHDIQDQIKYIKMSHNSSIHDVLNAIEQNDCKTHFLNQAMNRTSMTIDRIDVKGHHLNIQRNSINQSFMESSHRAVGATAETAKKEMSFIEEVIFDQKLRFIIAYGKKQFVIYNLDFDQSKIYSIDTIKYEQICDMAFRSISNEQFICCVAVKRKVVNQINVFDYFANKKSARLELDPPPSPGKKLEKDPINLKLNYGHSPTNMMKVKISFDFKTAVFTDMDEKFIVEQKNGYTIQRKLNMLAGKIVHYIFQCQNEASGFYFLQSKDFDGSLKLSHSNRDKKLFKINRNIEPGIIKIFDFSIQEQSQKNQNFTTKTFRIIGMQDEDFTYDQINFDEKPSNVENPANQIFIYRNLKVMPYIFSYMRAQSTSWPYFAYSGFSNYILLIDAFNRKFIHRIQLADESQNITICDTYITDTYDLFVLTLNSGLYKLYMVDLDLANLNECKEEEIDDIAFSKYAITEPVFQYHSEDVNGDTFIAMHVRGSSRKEALDRNEKQFVYFLHESSLYSWTKMSEESKKDKIKLVSKTASTAFHQIKDGLFVFLQDIKDKDDKLVEQKIIKLQTNFSQFQMTTAIKRISDSKDKIVALMMDQITNYILFVTQTKEVTAESDLNIIKLKLFDLNTLQSIFEIPLKNEHFIGRLKSGLCTLINGHIYFNNNLIKIRYDLISSPMNYKFEEHQIFDFYSDIFALKPTTKIRTRTPLKSIRYHRVVYITKDLNHEETQRIMILPFLHEKRVYLNRMKNNSYYFYSSIDTPLREIDGYNQSLIKQYKKQMSKESYQFETQRTLRQSMRAKTMPSNEEDSNISIICMNLSECKYYVYGTDGILENRIDYESQQNLYGPPVGTSSSGQYFIFRKELHEIENLRFLSDEQRIERYMTISILKMTIFDFNQVKKINLYKNIKEYLLQQNDREQLKHLNWLYHLKFEDINDVDFQFVVNDKMDVCIRINKKTSLEYDENGERLDRHKIEINIPDHKQEYCTIYYYENGQYSSNDSINGECMQSIYVTNTHGGIDYLINRNNLFFWSDHVIKFCYLKDGIDNEKNFIQVNFRQDNIEKFSYFKDLRTSSDPDMFVFIVYQSPGNNSIFTWFTKDNAEAEAYDVSEHYELLWDKLGNLYIITENKVIFNRQRCSIKAYDFQDLLAENHKFQIPNNILSNKRGHRFDYKNHNWLIYREYISLPFSYLTFMMKSKIEKRKYKTNYFDPVPYDYIFNKGTSFTDGDFVKKDSNQLSKVLSNFERIDPGLLQLLIYNQPMVFAIPDPSNPNSLTHLPAGSNTPLYIAVIENNNRSVDIILSYMTKINFNSSRNFMNIFPSLVNYQNFIMYLANLPVQTALMQQKQVLRVQDTYNDNIVKICESPCVNIDDKFYKQMMEEQEVNSTNYKSFPVKVVAFRFAWLILNPEGKMFLQSIFKSENLMYYRMPTMQMIIEFLYLKYKDVLLKKLLPAFVLQAFLFQAMIYTFEGYYSKYRENTFEEEGITYIRGSRDLLPYKILGIILLLMNLGMACILIYFQYLLIKNMGKPYFYRFYGLIDVVYIILITMVQMICFYQLVTDHWIFTFDQFEKFTKVQRNLEAICVFLIYVKAGYFLSLIESIAPLMDNISQVLSAIRSFVFLLLMYIFAFSFCFYLLGQNQIYFDDIPASQMAKVGIPYDTFRHSIWFVYTNYMMGGKFHKSFDLGNSTQSFFLYLLFIIASCYIDVILLKMLVAIMQSTFASRKLVAEEIKVKDHLRFLLDNWHLMDYALKDKSQVTYIISAFTAPAVTQKDKNYENLKNDMQALDLQQQDNFKMLQYDINQVNLMLQTLEKIEKQSQKQDIKTNLMKTLQKQMIK